MPGSSARARPGGSRAGLRRLRGLALCRDLAEEGAGHKPGYPFVVLAGRARAAQHGRAPPPDGQRHTGPPLGRRERLIDDHCRGHGLLQRLREQRHRVRERPPRVYAAPKGTAILGK